MGVAIRDNGWRRSEPWRGGLRLFAMPFEAGRSGSFRRGGRSLGSGGDIPMKAKHDWSATDALTDEEIHAAAMADPDVQRLTQERLA